MDENIMTSNCELIGISEEQARINMVTYIQAAFAAASEPIKSLEIIYPNMKPPDLEGRTSPFILMDINPVYIEQTGMGETTYKTTKSLDISLWIREYTGVKLVGNLVDFLKGLGVKTVSNVSYGVPFPAKKQKYKGWEAHPVFLPIRF